MSEFEQLRMLKTMTGETDDAVLNTYLQLAGSKVLRRAYPCDPSQTKVPEQYKTVQLEVAAYLLNKRGAEGQTSHSENGISRGYEDGDVPPSLMRQIVPFASVLKGRSEE